MELPFFESKSVCTLRLKTLFQKHIVQTGNNLHIDLLISNKAILLISNKAIRLKLISVRALFISQMLGVNYNMIINMKQTKLPMLSVKDHQTASLDGRFVLVII